VADPGQTDVGPRVEGIDELAERALDDLCVRIKEQRVSSVGALPSPVVGVSEAGVTGGDHASLRKCGFHELTCPVRRLVVDYEHFEGSCARIRVEAGKAWAKPALLVRRDEYDREIV
jgi:hypothetical protein